MKLEKSDLNSTLDVTRDGAKFNSDTVEMLGFTREYLNLITGEKLPDNIIELAGQIALTSAKLNYLCSKFDKLLSVAKVLDVQRKQIEWAEMVSAKRAERTAKERVKLARKLKGIDRKIYQRTGDLPHEYEARMKEAFKEFMERMTDGN